MAAHSRSKKWFKEDYVCVQVNKDCGMTKYIGIDIPVYPDYISEAL